MLGEVGLGFPRHPCVCMWEGGTLWDKVELYRGDLQEFPSKLDTATH